MILPSLNKKQGLFLGIVFVFIYILPYVILGEDSYITIHDFLDSSIAHIKAVLDNNAVFDGTKTIPILSGLQRSLFFSVIDIKFIPFLLLSPYWAIVVNILLIKLTAFIGIYLLLDKYILDEGKNKNLINLGVSICFAFIPFYVDYGISSAGIPLIIYAFLNLQRRNNIRGSYLIIIYFGFYSSLVLSGLFLCIVLFLFFLYNCINNKKFYKYYFIGLCLLSLIYIGTNINLFISHFISDGFISHRTEFYNEMTFRNVIMNVWNIICFSQYHAGPFLSLPIIVIFLSIWFKYHQREKNLTLYLFGLTFIIGIIGIAYLLQLTFPNIEFFKSFQFDRFYFLYPSLCLVILAVCVQKLFYVKKEIVGMLFLLCMISTTITHDLEFKYFIKSIITNNKTINQPSYKQFYDEKLFNEIESSISIQKRAEYNVVCLGMHPAILEYNNFHTLDGYFYQYPLSYKHKFRSIIEKELEKSSILRSYYDDWGSRCYIFSSELGSNYMWGKEKNNKVLNLEIDTKVLREMNCSYIFSAVEIKNYKTLNLDPVGEYTTPESYWNIYVYKI